MTFEQFKTIIPVDLLERLTNINMCGNYGDPGMCKDVYEIIERIYQVVPYVQLITHTNGGMRDEKFWYRLGQLNSLMPNATVVFSIDGLEDTNHLYRVGVDWHKLMSNVRAFIEGGGKAVWDYLVFAHNEHQIEDARLLAKEMKFFTFVEGKPHSFNYNGKMRVVDREGKFIRHLDQSAKFNPMPTVLYNDISFDINKEYVVDFFKNVKTKATDTTSSLYEFQMKEFSKLDHIEVNECTALHIKEIYIDSDGGVHPCCYMGHISQDAMPIPELVYHKKWIDDTIGLENINALNKPVKEIMESYFSLIEQSWSKTFKQGRNPMCVFKCGIQRATDSIRTGREDNVSNFQDNVLSPEPRSRANGLPWPLSYLSDHEEAYNDYKNFIMRRSPAPRRRADDLPWPLVYLKDEYEQLTPRARSPADDLPWPLIINEDILS